MKEKDRGAGRRQKNERKEEKWEEETREGTGKGMGSNLTTCPVETHVIRIKWHKRGHCTSYLCQPDPRATRGGGHSCGIFS